jgi:hypothetical protein
VTRRRAAAAPPAEPRSRLRCYAVFHLNLAFSSIEEADRPRVVTRCYWPLVELIRRQRLPIGIEASGYTLEAAAAIDPDWLAALRGLVSEGPAEFVGSGYAQLIGPLVPADVVRANLALGHEAYERLLGFRPTIAFVNEQAWSASLAAHYRDAAYRAVIMEWENPRTAHPEWPDEWQYHPQRVKGQDGADIPILWSHTIAFQKLQRYAHGEMEADEYLDYVLSHGGAGDRLLSIYASDAEVFDYRPGRYKSESALAAVSEWERLDHVFGRLSQQPEIALVTPSRALSEIAGADAGHEVRLETADKPIPVKKQPKYDLARWAITGRDDLGVNTACWRAYDALRQRNATDAEWRELCYLWSSDFRTHITPRRWSEYVDRVKAFGDRLGTALPGTPDALATPHLVTCLPDGVKLERQGRYLKIATGGTDVILNCRRGLAVEALTFPDISDVALCGSVPHGYFDDIAWSADQYTGFLVLAAAGQPQVTDLEPAEPVVGWNPDRQQLVVKSCMRTSLGVIEKHVLIDVTRPRLSIAYRLHWATIPLGTLRLGHVTLLPAAFDASSLYVAAHNGGDALERFELARREVDHVVPVSHLVSCRGGLGATGGTIEIGDANRAIRIEIDRRAASLFPLVTMRHIGARYFCRVTLSAREMDETSRHEGTGRSPFIDHFAFAIAPVITG